jgi:hypothetical protein
MDMLDYDDEDQPTRSRQSLIWNILTGLALLGVLCVAGLFILIFTNPYSRYNPFPPPSLPVAMALPTATPTLRSLLPPTWTPTATLPPTATHTPTPTATLPPTATAFTLVTPSPSPDIPTSTPSTKMNFEVQSGGPVAIPNIAYPDLGCNWLGVGGQAADMSGGPVTGLPIRLGGVFNGRTVQESLSLTGVAPQYGRAGYEFKLADSPVASKGSLWVQLIDQSGVPMSEKVYFDTYEDCERNLVIINFKQVR